MNELGIEIKESSNTRYLLADGHSITSLGKTELEIEIEGKKIFLKVRIIDSQRKDLILGIEFIDKMKGEINTEKEELTLKMDK